MKDFMELLSRIATGLENLNDNLSANREFLEKSGVKPAAKPAAKAKPADEEDEPEPKKTPAKKAAAKPAARSKPKEPEEETGAVTGTEFKSLLADFLDVAKEEKKRRVLYIRDFLDVFGVEKSYELDEEHFPTLLELMRRHEDGERVDMETEAREYFEKVNGAAGDAEEDDI